MEKEFCTYNQALRLKALGFDEPCFSFYMGGFKELGKIKYVNPSNVAETNVLAPTFSQAFRWILKNHKLHSFVDIYPTTDEPDRCWFMIRYLERDEDGKEDYMSGWFTNQDNINNSRLNKLLEIIESKAE